MTRRALLLGLLMLAPALAGCASEAPGAEPVSKGSTPSGSNAGGAPGVSPPAQEVRPRGTSERWHFHDYWKGNPTITLLETNVTLNATLTSEGVPALSAVFELPHGTIVPPETGYLTFNVSWEGPLTKGLVNLTYKPADSNTFQKGGDLSLGVPFLLPTTESNCDVPHRQSSAWKFNLTAAPGGSPPEMPGRDVHVVIQATIGRPLFIDPPHLNWWRFGETLTIVSAGGGDIRTARTAAGNLTLPGGVPSPTASQPTPGQMQEAYRVPVDDGVIVPEGTRSIVAMLNWTAASPNAPKLALEYAENNYPTSGPMELSSESGTSRVYILKVAAAQTDTTYSNRTTWEFRVLPDGDTAAFDGSFTLVAWASRLEGADAIRAVSG